MWRTARTRIITPTGLNRSPTNPITYNRDDPYVGDMSIIEQMVSDSKKRLRVVFVLCCL
jgi:hypothetical protein